MFKKIINLNKNGYIFTKVLKDNNIPTVYLTRLRKKGLIKKVASGAYILTDYIEDEFYINYLKNKDLIYTNNTALYLQELTPKQFENYQVNFLYGKNVSNVKNLDYKVLRNKSIYELGKEFVLTPMGNLVPCYDKERSICNIFMLDFCDEEVKAFAIKEYKNSAGEITSTLTKANVKTIFNLFTAFSIVSSVSTAVGFGSQLFRKIKNIDD